MIMKEMKISSVESDVRWLLDEWGRCDNILVGMIDKRIAVYRINARELLMNEPCPVCSSWALFSCMQFDLRWFVNVSEWLVWQQFAFMMMQFDY